MQEIVYSIVVPVFNSATSLDEFYSRLESVMNEQGKSWELLLIDDGSTDESWKRIHALKSAHPEAIRAIQLAGNFGQHNATFAGLSFVAGQLIITMDDDLQMQPEDIPLLVKQMEEDDSDLVYARFPNKKHSASRNAGSKVLKKGGKFFNGSPGEGSSFRLFTREIADQLLTHNQQFIFIDELLLWYTDSISFVELPHFARKAGKSGYNRIKLFRLTANIVLYYSALPLRIMTWGGFAFSFIFFLIGIYYLVRKVFFKVPAGYTSTIVAILFSTSIIIFCLGIIGEYLNRIYMVQNRRPAFRVKKLLK